MRRVWAHGAMVLVGIVAIMWALTWGAHPLITCRDQVMQPGDVCVNAQGTRQQTYEERWAAAMDARPVVAGVGVLLVGFGAALAAAELRRAGSSGRTRPDHPRAA